MKIIFYDTQKYDKEHFDEVNKKYNYEIHYLEAHLNAHTASLSKGYDVVCAFVNDTLDKKVLTELKGCGIRLIALRSAGYNNVDLNTAKALKIPVVRVPAYSPEAVAEAAAAMLLTLDRKLQHAYVRTREFNFSLNGLVGFNLYGKTAGVIGTGKIGRAFIRIAQGFGMNVIAYDPYPAKIDGVEYVSPEELFKRSDIISLHCPLTDENRHIIRKETISEMKDGVIIINTSRGGLIDSEDLLDALKSHKIGGAALDVYEEESGIFFEDQSEEGIEDDNLARLISMPNVLITGHQAFLTHEALDAISTVTLENIKAFEGGQKLVNEVLA